MANPILVAASRGPLVESWHRGALALCDAAGAVRASLGDIERPIYPRSALKPIQALPLIESGAADGFGLGAAEIALACGSHSGTPRHTEAVTAWLARLGCTEQDLACGPHEPLDAAAAQALHARGQIPGRRHNNCSGKHAGFLTTARHLGLPLAGYTDLDHPIQRRVRATLADLAGCAPDRLVAGIDGCSAPNFALPLRALARAAASLADPSALAPALQAAARRVIGAMRAHPDLVAGPGRFCTRVIARAAGGAVVKAGAEGVFLAVLPAQRLGAALKIDDGAGRAAQVAMAHLLAARGALDRRDPEVAALLRPCLRNWRGDRIGELRPGADWPAELMP